MDEPGHRKGQYLVRLDTLDVSLSLPPATRAKHSLGLS